VPAIRAQPSANTADETKAPNQHLTDARSGGIRGQRNRNRVFCSNCIKHTSFQVRARRLNRLVCYGISFLIIAMAYVEQASAQTCTPVRPDMVGVAGG
jgi:hypothetical protein